MSQSGNISFYPLFGVDDTSNRYKVAMNSGGVPHSMEPPLASTPDAKSQAPDKARRSGK